MLKYVLASLLLAVVWAVVLVLGLPVAIAIVFTTVVVLALVVAWVVRRARARTAAQGLERALTAQAAQHAMTVRPEQQGEIQAMQGEFEKAIASLKGSRLGRGRGGVEALYALPWYVMIGPPGTGKSTALKNSGLQFPYLGAGGGGVKGVGGTRNCEWWLTNEAVMLDTAGRYTTEDDDREEWLAFLDLLRRFRPRKPINGVLVAVSVGDIGGAHEADVANLARRVRERIDEVMARLRMVVPVYLLFTKCDLVPGFVETFGDLRKQERGQIWGFTVPLGHPPGHAGELCAERFDQLAAVASARGLRRLGEERRPEVREKIYEFPQQFEALRANIVDFVGALFAENVYQGTPIMRGVYFTSGTQQGRPIDRVMSAMAEAFGVRRRVAAAEPVVESKSYFLRDVFANVVFPDQDVAARSADEVLRGQHQRYAIAGGALGLAALVLALPAYAFVRNRALVRATRASAEAVAARRAADAAPLPLAALEPLRQRVEELQRYRDDGPPALLRFGMYGGESLRPHVQDLYAATLRRDVVGPIVRREAAEMEAFGQRYENVNERPTREEYARYYDMLKTHLLLTGPAEAGQPAPTEAQRAWLTNRIVDRWMEQDQTGADPVAARRTMTANAATYVRLLAEDPRLAFPRAGIAVRRVRSALVNIPVVDLAVDQLVASVDTGGYTLTLASIMGDTVTVVRSAPENRVRGAFTRRGWEEHVRARLGATLDEITGESWVLGRTPDRTEAARHEEQIARIRSQYFARYVDEWRNFLAGTRVPDPGDNGQVLLMLQELTRGEPPPLGALFRSLAYNTHLEEARPTGVASVTAQAQQGVVDRLRQRFGGADSGVVAAAGQAVNTLHGGSDPVGERFLTAEDVEAAFAGFYRFGAPPPGAAANAAPGAPAPPAGSLPLQVYQEQLEFVRDALVTFRENPTGPSTPLMAALQTARTRVEALINSQEVGWRPRFRALLWPPIAGAARSSANSIGAGTGRSWCSAVVVPFERTLRGRYPFDPTGQDAALADVADFFRPTTGVLWTFYDQALRGDVPRAGDHFEFSRQLGRSAAEIYRGELLNYLNRAQEISTVLFANGSAAPGTQFEVRIRPAAGVATVSFEVDGQRVEYHNGPEQWHAMHWPGEGRVRGAAIHARGTGVDETVQQEGEWGLFRLLEQGTVHGSPRARIFSAVWSLRDANVEIGVDIRPARTENPFLGVPRRDDTAQILRSFRGGDALAPRNIAHAGGCDLGGAPSPAPRRRPRRSRNERAPRDRAHGSRT